VAQISSKRMQIARLCAQFHPLLYVEPVTQLRKPCKTARNGVQGWHAPRPVQQSTLRSMTRRDRRVAPFIGSDARHWRDLRDLGRGCATACTTAAPPRAHRYDGGRGDRRWESQAPNRRGRVVAPHAGHSHPGDHRPCETRYASPGHRTTILAPQTWVACLSRMSRQMLQYSHESLDLRLLRTLERRALHVAAVDRVGLVGWS
jgi:hypothetical protein